MRHWLAAFGGVGLSVLTGFACSSPQLCDNNRCVNPDAEAGDGSTLDVPAKCDLSKDPKDSPDCVDESVGVFVSPMGSDGAPGTKAMPVQTIGTGFDVAKMKGLPRVYVCAGTYGSLVLDDKRDGVSAYGGFDCAGWMPGSAPTLVKSSDNKSALVAQNLTAGVSLVDLQFQSQDATAPGDSSVAALLTNAKLTLRRAKVEAGKGASAAKAADPMDFSPLTAPVGKNGDANNGGGKTDNLCANGSGTSTGGAGGPPGVSGNDGNNGSPFAMYPVNPPLADGAKGLSGGGTCVTGIGHNGSYGPGAATGGGGAAKLGALDGVGWHPEAGGAGTQGKVGQGGGGGASLDNAGGGGGGGAGGCGGDAGKGGAGGGASIAMVSVSSTLTLEQTTLLAKNAGDGAQGQTGQKAQGAGAGGNPGPSQCQGGAGGHGGSGAGGGGGAGGVSLGLAYVGTAPKIDGETVMDAMTRPSITIGAAGMPGAASQGGPPFKTMAPASNGGASGTAGIPGVAQAVKGF